MLLSYCQHVYVPEKYLYIIFRSRSRTWVLQLCVSNGQHPPRSKGFKVQPHGLDFFYIVQPTRLFEKFLPSPAVIVADTYSAIKDDRQTDKSMISRIWNVLREIPSRWIFAVLQLSYTLTFWSFDRKTPKQKQISQGKRKVQHLIGNLQNVFVAAKGEVLQYLCSNEKEPWVMGDHMCSNRLDCFRVGLHPAHSVTLEKSKSI